jgi:hypothetical protein
MNDDIFPKDDELDEETDPLAEPSSLSEDDLDVLESSDDLADKEAEEDEDDDMDDLEADEM